MGTLTASTAAIVLSASKAQAKDVSEIARIAKAISINPNNGILYRKRAFIKILSKDYQNACIDLQIAKSLGDKIVKRDFKKGTFSFCF